MGIGPLLAVFSLFWIACSGEYPNIPGANHVPFYGYFISYYRGICGASLVSRTVMITAAICVVDPASETRDIRPLKVVLGTTYRHITRGIKTQVRQILLPVYPKVNDELVRSYMIQKSAALLILRWHVPDGMGEMPLRGIGLDFEGEELLRVGDECLAFGNHYYFAGDVLELGKYPLQRNLRVQLLLIAKVKQWCKALNVKYDNVMRQIGYDSFRNEYSEICVRDVTKSAQPCHGMYGTPLICQGKIAAIMTSPDRQWRNCTSFSGIYERIYNRIHFDFLNCSRILFNAEFNVDVNHLKHPLDRPDEDLMDYSDLYGALNTKVALKNDETVTI